MMIGKYREDYLKRVLEPLLLHDRRGQEFLAGRRYGDALVRVLDLDVIQADAINLRPCLEVMSVAHMLQEERAFWQMAVALGDLGLVPRREGLGAYPHDLDGECCLHGDWNSASGTLVPMPSIQCVYDMVVLKKFPRLEDKVTLYEEDVGPGEEPVWRFEDAIIRTDPSWGLVADCFGEARYGYRKV